MNQPKFPFDKDPAEGSRETVDHQLDQAQTPANGSTDAARTEPAKKVPTDAGDSQNATSEQHD